MRDVLENEDELGNGEDWRVNLAVDDVREAQKRDALLDGNDLWLAESLQHQAHDADGSYEATEEGARQDDVEEAEPEKTEDTGDQANLERGHDGNGRGLELGVLGRLVRVAPHQVFNELA